MLEYLGPVTGGFKANVEGIHMIAERALQHCAQASERWDGPEGIAMGLNNTSIGIRFQEGV